MRVFRHTRDTGHVDYLDKETALEGWSPRRAAKTVAASPHHGGVRRSRQGWGSADPVGTAEPSGFLAGQRSTSPPIASPLERSSLDNGLRLPAPWTCLTIRTAGR